MVGGTALALSSGGAFAGDLADAVTTEVTSAKAEILLVAVAMLALTGVLLLIRYVEVGSLMTVGYFQAPEPGTPEWERLTFSKRPFICRGRRRAQAISGDTDQYDQWRDRNRPDRPDIALGFFATGHLGAWELSALGFGHAVQCGPRGSRDERDPCSGGMWARPS